MVFQKHKTGYYRKKPALRRYLVLFLFIVPTGLAGQIPAQLILSSNKDSVKQGFIAPYYPPVIGSIEKYIQLNQEHPSEKIFIHLDRPNYMQSDTIWFKAYLWYGYDQIPDTVSEVLHVDLIGPQSNVKLRRKLLIKNGTSQGDFCLDTTISPGSYLIRAYTRLKQNQDDGEPFYQMVTINPANQNFQFECLPFIIKQIGNNSLKIRLRFFEIDQTGDLNSKYQHEIKYSLKIGDQLVQKDSILAVNSKERVLKYSLAGLSTNDSLAAFGITIQDNSITFEKQFHIPLREGLDLQFLPEGGTLVNSLQSKVAFKAIGADGLAREVNGEIQTEDGSVVGSFKSMHKGMGFFMLKPDIRKKYFADLWYNNVKYIVPLPPVSDQGTVMSVSFSEKSMESFLTLKQNFPVTNNPKYIIGSSYGKIWFSALVKPFRDSCSFRIPSELLPEGVCRLTILNEVFKPECERLIYVDKNQRFKIEIIPDSSSYGTRSKVTLLLKATGQGGEPVPADLSLAVTDKEQTTKDVDVPGISAYKLLESELHGYIEDADSYFNDNGIANKSSLDLLLLTHGYRKFVTIGTISEELKLLPEKTIDITGRIKYNGSKSRENKFNYRDIDLTLLSTSGNYYLAKSNPDSLGTFRFQLPLRYGKAHSLLQATTIKKKPFTGDIIIDNPVAPLQAVKPLSVDYNIVSPVVEWVSRMQAGKKTEISKNPSFGYMSKTLGEVVVKGKAKAKYWHGNYEKVAIKIANLDSLDPGGNRYKDLNDLLVQEFGAIIWTSPDGDLRSVSFPCIQTIVCFECPIITYFPPIYVIDGKTYWNGDNFDFSPLYTIFSFPVNEIKKIMILPPMKTEVIYHASKDIYGDPFFIYQSMVVIDTYSKNTYRGDAQGVKTFILDGLDVPRVFYSPRYEGQLKQSPEYDGRATLYWEPSKKTDANGQVKVEFYTSDRKTDLEVIVNGIETENGYTGEGHAHINLNLK